MGFYLVLFGRKKLVKIPLEMLTNIVTKFVSILLWFLISLILVFFCLFKNTKKNQLVKDDLPFLVVRKKSGREARVFRDRVVIVFHAWLYFTTMPTAMEISTRRRRRAYSSSSSSSLHRHFHISSFLSSSSSFSSHSTSRLSNKSQDETIVESSKILCT